MFVDLNFHLEGGTWDFGDTLGLLREEHHSGKLTLIKLEELTGISRATLNRLENHQAPPYTCALSEIANLRSALEPSPEMFAELAGAYAKAWLSHIQSLYRDREADGKAEKLLAVPIIAMVDLWDAANDSVTLLDADAEERIEQAFKRAAAFVQRSKKIVVNSENDIDSELDQFLQPLRKEYDVVVVHPDAELSKHIPNAWVYVTLINGKQNPSTRWKAGHAQATQLKTPTIGICLDDAALEVSQFYQMLPLTLGDTPAETADKLLKTIRALVDLRGQIDWWQHLSRQNPTPKQIRKVGIAPQSLDDETFVGRESETAQLLDLLLAREGRQRLINIHGGSTGKTALASYTMRKLLDHPDTIDGLVYLHSEATFEDIYLQLGAVLGDKTRQIFRNLAHTLSIDRKINFVLEAIGAARIVILLDGLDYQLDANGQIKNAVLRSFIETFVIREHGGQLLITSRQPLGLSADAMPYVRLFPLTHGLENFEGVQLLRQLDTKGLLADDPDTALSQIVDRAEGLPQALIHIAWLLLNTPITLTELLQNESLFYEEMITKLVREAQAKLDGVARRMMQAFAVMARQPNHLPLTEKVAYSLLDPLPPAQVQTTIDFLIDTNFIRKERETGIIKLSIWHQKFFYEELQSDSEQYHFLERQAAHYYANVLNSPDQANYYELKLVQIDHLLMGQAYGDALDLLEALNADPLRRWDRVTLIQHLPFEIVLRFRERLAAVLEGVSATRNWYGIALILMIVGQYPEAEGYFKRVQSTDDADLQMLCQLGLGVCRYHQQYYEEAAAIYQQLLAMPEITRDPYLYSIVLNNLASVARDQGDPEAALDYCEQSLAAANEISGERGQFMKTSYLETRARIFRYLMRNWEAIEQYEELLQIQHNLKNRREEASLLSRYGMVSQDIGLWEEELTYQQWALEIANDVGDYRTRCKTLERLANLHIALGNFEQAQTDAQASLAIAELINNRRKIGYCHLRFGQMSLARGLFSNAESELARAEQCFEETGNRFDQQDSKNQLAKLYLFQHDVEQALEKSNEALGCNITFFNHQSLLLRGVALLLHLQTSARQGTERDTVYDALGRSAEAAEQILAKTSRFYTARLTRALALTGITLLSDTEQQAKNMKSTLIAWGDLYPYRAFRGTLNEGWRIFQLLRSIDTTNVLEPLEQAITKELAPSTRHLFL